MTLFAAIGKARGLDATDAAVQATDQALAQTGRHNISLAIIAASHDYPVHQVVNGVAGLLSDTPLLGFSTPAQLTAEGVHQRSIVVALLVGDQLRATSDWWAGSSNGGDQVFFQDLYTSQLETKALLVVAEGLLGDALGLVNSIPNGSISLAGCLAGGDFSGDRTFQIGGNSYGSGGIAAAALGGNIHIGIGSNHGWQPVGIYLRVTGSDELWVHTLDGRRACEAYADAFGYSARDWTFPPLNQLIRLYPLGFESEENGQANCVPCQIRSPLRVESDGSLRMNSRIPQGKTAHLLVTSTENCITAAKLAAQQAVDALGDAKPILGLIFADIAWQLQLQAQPGSEVKAIQEVIGEAVPIIGGYTFGQLGKTGDGIPELLNQHIQVILFGDPGE